MVLKAEAEMSKAVVLRSWCLLRFTAKEHKIASAQPQWRRRSSVMLRLSAVVLAFFYFLFLFFLETAKTFGPVNQDWISDGYRVLPETFVFRVFKASWRNGFLRLFFIFYQCFFGIFDDFSKFCRRSQCAYFKISSMAFPKPETRVSGIHPTHH